MVAKWPNRLAYHFGLAKDALKGVAAQKLPENKWVHVFVTYDGSAKPEGLKIYVDGAEQPLNFEAQSLTGTIRTGVPLSIGKRNATSPANGVRIQDLRVYSRLVSKADIDLIRSNDRQAYLIAKHAPRSEAENAEMYEWYLENQNPEYNQVTAELASAKNELNQAIARGTIAHVMQEKTIRSPWPTSFSEVTMTSGAIKSAQRRPLSFRRWAKVS